MEWSSVKLQGCSELLVNCPCSNTRLAVDDVCVKLVLRKEETLAPYLADLAKLSITLLGEKTAPKALLGETKVKLDPDKPIGTLSDMVPQNRLYGGKKREVVWVCSTPELHSLHEAPQNTRQPITFWRSCAHHNPTHTPSDPHWRCH